MILPLEQQVCSLELAKKLKELGVKQESYFIWVETRNFGTKVYPEDFSFELDFFGSVRVLASAFTVAELGEMLPKSINIPYKNGKGRQNDHYVHFYHSETMNTWQINYVGSSFVRPFVQAETEADARALLLIHLVENKLITL